MPQTRTGALPTLLTAREVADALRLSVDTIYRMAANGELHALRVSEKPGASLRIPAAELDRILERADTPDDGGEA